MEDDRWTGRELKANELPGVAALLERGRLADTLFVKAALEKGEAFKGWWYGGLRNGTALEAVMAVENHKAHIYAHSDAASRGMGYELYQQQKRIGSAMQATHRHQLFGELKTVSNIWHYLKDLPDRKAVGDRTCGLLEVGERPEKNPSGRVDLAVATEDDLRLVVDLTAEAITEQTQQDPRKAGREAHVARCEHVIRRGLQIIAREEGRPFFVAELAKQTSDVIVLDRLHVPTQFRSRPRLIAGAFWHAAALASRIGGRRLFALTTDSAITEAATNAGWRLASTYRWCIALG